MKPNFLAKNKIFFEVGSIKTI